MKCRGCGTEDCSARKLHEAVWDHERGMSQVERLAVMRRHGIEPPNGHLDEQFGRAVVVALLRLEAQLNGLPDTRAEAAGPRRTTTTAGRPSRTLRLSPDDVRLVNCPRCGAGAGDPCFYQNGTKVKRCTNHKERKTKAREKLA